MLQGIKGIESTRNMEVKGHGGPTLEWRPSRERWDRLGRGCSDSYVKGRNL